MDYKEIKHLLDLYLEGNTNLSEEENLRLFFKSTKELPPEWESFRSFFGYYDQAKLERYPQEITKRKSLFRPWMAAASLVAIVLSLQFYSSSLNALSTDEMDAQIAFDQFKDNMKKVSSLLNKGAKQVSYLDYWNETTQKLIK